VAHFTSVIRFIEWSVFVTDIPSFRYESHELIYPFDFSGFELERAASSTIEYSLLKFPEFHFTVTVDD